MITWNDFLCLNVCKIRNASFFYNNHKFGFYSVVKWKLTIKLVNTNILEKKKKKKNANKEWVTCVSSL